MQAWKALWHSVHEEQISEMCLMTVGNILFCFQDTSENYWLCLSNVCRPRPSLGLSSLTPCVCLLRADSRPVTPSHWLVVVKRTKSSNLNSCPAGLVNVCVCVYVFCLYVVQNMYISPGALETDIFLLLKFDAKYLTVIQPVVLYGIKVWD